MSSESTQNPVTAAASGVWDALFNTRKDCICFGTTPAALRPLLENIPLRNMIPDQARLQNLVELLCKDTREASEALEKIFERHKDRTGRATSPDDHMAGLQIGELYAKWCIDFEALILPTVSEITDMFAALETQLSAPPAVSTPAESTSTQE